jgi:SAM-dependent methyltransferase
MVFLDADDRLLPEALEAGLECFHAHPECAFVSGRARVIAADGSLLKQRQPHVIEEDPYLALLRGNYIGMNATVMYRRATLQSVGGFNSSVKLAEDYDLYFRIASKFPVNQHDRVIAEYRRHETNMSRNPGLMLKATIEVLRSQRRHIKGNKLYRKAYNAGVKNWRSWYGDWLVEYVRTRTRKGEWKRAMEGTYLLFRYYPRGLMLLLSGRGHMKRQPQKTGGRVSFGSLRRTTPISRQFGFDRGQPIDRYYIEKFLAYHANDIRGRVLEIGDASYTRRFGGNRVTLGDVLHVTQGNPQATIVADLTRADHIPSDAFDCIVLTQTLHHIYDVRSAIRTIQRILKPGGVLLATFPGISQIATDEWGSSWYWAFTSQSARRLSEEVFPAENVKVEAHGNVLTAISFLHGLAVEELHQEELDSREPGYEVLITLRAVKAGMSP